MTDKTALYKSPEWRKMHPFDRAHFIPVLEDALLGEHHKPGILISGSTEAFAIAEMAGLAVNIEEWGGHHGNERINLLIAAPQELLDFQYSLLALREGKPTRGRYVGTKDRRSIDGKFFGYAPCCVENPLAERTFPELHAHYERGGTQPALCNYIWPDTSTCALDCAAAFEKYKLWNDVTAAIDPEAAEHIVQMNRRHFGREETKKYAHIFREIQASHSDHGHH
jgi:hypothetical protein